MKQTHSTLLWRVPWEITDTFVYETAWSPAYKAQQNENGTKAASDFLQEGESQAVSCSSELCHLSAAEQYCWLLALGLSVLLAAVHRLVCTAAHHLHTIAVQSCNHVLHLLWVSDRILVSYQFCTDISKRCHWSWCGVSCGKKPRWPVWFHPCYIYKMIYIFFVQGCKDLR